MEVSIRDPYKEAQQLRTERLINDLQELSRTEGKAPTDYVGPEVSEGYIEHFLESEQEYAQIICEINPHHPLLEVATHHMLSRLYQDPYVFDDKGEGCVWQDTLESNLVAMLLATVACHTNEMVYDAVDNPQEFSVEKITDLREQIIDNLNYGQPSETQRNPEDMSLVSVDVVNPDDVGTIISTPPLDYNDLRQENRSDQDIRSFVDNLLLYSLDFMTSIPQYQQEDALDPAEIIEEEIEPQQPERSRQALIDTVVASVREHVPAEQVGLVGRMQCELPPADIDAEVKRAAEKASEACRRKKQEERIKEATLAKEVTSIKDVSAVRLAVSSLKNYVRSSFLSTPKDSSKKPKKKEDWAPFR